MSSERYTVAAISVGGSIVMGYAPEDKCYLSIGDEVRLENGARGVVYLIDKYVTHNDAKEIEGKTREFQKIMVVYSAQEVEWDE